MDATRLRTGWLKELNQNLTPNFMKAESQVKQIFDYLMNGCRLTGLEAIKKFGSIKLSNRIGEAEKRYGVTIDNGRRSRPALERRRSWSITLTRGRNDRHRTHPKDQAQRPSLY